MFVAGMATMFALGEEGTERHWTGLAGNNDWTDSGNYDAAGKPDPEAQDTLVFPSDARVTLNGNDADSCNIAQHLYRMKVADGASNVVLTVNVPENGIVNIDGAIVPTGNSYSDSSYKALTVYKTGAGDLLLNSFGKVKAGAAYITDYYANFMVVEGSVHLPTNMTGNTYVGCLTVSNGASFFTGIGGVTTLMGFYGDGLVTNDAKSAQQFRVNSRGDFYGALNGSITYASRGLVMLHGTNSTMSADLQITYNQHNNPGVLSSARGITGLAKIGRAGEPSSAGTGSKIIASSEGSVLLYLGKGEHTDKNYETRAPNYISVIDGGAYGGLVWEGDWAQKSGYLGMANLVLRGTNSTPCEMSGAVKSHSSSGTNYTFHISKQGSGTWHFHHNANTTMTGGFTVHEGTLRFDTIGETNVVTSLGKATNLGMEYFSWLWDKDKVVPYAHTLGDRVKKTTGTLEYMGETNCYSSTRSTVISGTGVLKQSGTGALVMSGFSPIDANAATLVLDGGNTSISNVAANVTNSASGGVLSVVKRGAGTWSITENATFTGPLSVEEGTLILKPAETNYTWFRWTWQKRFANNDTSDSPKKTLGASEFGLYDAEGNRCNLNLSDRGDCNDDVTSNQFYYYPYIDDGGWFGWFDDGSWRYLQPGECSLGKTAYGFRTYRVWNNGTTIFANEPLYPSSMFDGKNEYFSGYVNGRVANLSDPTSWVPIILRLPEGSPAIKYWDYAHAAIAKRAVEVSKLEASVDGRHWEFVDSFDCEDNSAANTWQFKNVTIGHESESTLGAPGREIRGVTTNVWSFMTGNPLVSVKSGAVLKAVGNVTLKNIKIDAATGAGTFDGFTFAPDAEVEIANLNAGEACIVPAAFPNVSGLDGAAGWTWNFTSTTGRKLRGRAAVSATGVRYIPVGIRISIK